MMDLLLPSWLVGVLLACAAGPLGSFIVWQKMSYFGDALAHTSLLGGVCGILLNVNPFYTIIIISILLALGLIWLESYPQLSIDTILGIMAHSALSLGLIISSLMKDYGIKIDLLSYLFGDLLIVTKEDIYILSIIVFIVLFLIIWKWRALLSITISSELPHVDGIRLKQIKLLLVIIISLIIGIATKFVGALLITSLLIIPAATARRFSKSPEQMAILSIITGICSVTGGLVFSARYDTPAGPSIVFCASLLFLLSLFIKSRI
ncbi:zinc ABC transporter permease subunit ZnuB [Candidatus Schneideria nysicola]|uniref:zinc ABC transporter permease subunit ZnuB n=1 Tax=Candidatus Schneideria nysicola TaxID=1081631 RepID=UPI001CAA4B04|nr:zinc ABC transporter permease subunit ZnuB [Candidatus Schneideria nysicola]UAJ64896.1 zinc ABC transporter permease subunit ZnuB [Candidatus Schneideria nysicola]